MALQKNQKDTIKTHQVEATGTIKTAERKVKELNEKLDQVLQPSMLFLICC